MPCYLFQNPKTQEIKEIIQSMNDPHVYSEDGVEWKRVWTSPLAATDIRIDPNDPRAFVNKTSGKKGKLGDLFDRSRDLSEKRASKNGGHDEVKQKYYEDYAKARRGKRNPQEIREKTPSEIVI